MKNLSRAFLGCEELLYTERNLIQLLPADHEPRASADTSPSPLLSDFEQTLAAFAKREAANSIFYRARPGSKDENRAYEGDEMQAPPPDKVRTGRLNPAGVRVLYCAEDVRTAILEIHPARGMHVSVCQLRLQKEAKLLDLTVPLSTINKSLCAGGESSASNLKCILRILREELSRPLEGNDDDDDYQYRIGQRLGHYLRQSNYDGIRYPSALKSKGRNIMFFGPQLLVVGMSELAKIRRVNVAYELDSKFSFLEKVTQIVRTESRNFSHK